MIRRVGEGMVERPGDRRKPRDRRRRTPDPGQPFAAAFCPRQPEQPASRSTPTPKMPGTRRRGTAAPPPRRCRLPAHARPRRAGTAAASSTGSSVARRPSRGCWYLTRPPSKRSDVNGRRGVSGGRLRRDCWPWRMLADRPVSAQPGAAPRAGQPFRRRMPALCSSVRSVHAALPGCFQTPLDRFSAAPIWCSCSRQQFCEEKSLGGLASPRAAETVPVPTFRRVEAKTRLPLWCELVGDDLQACNRAIVARMDSPVALIPQLAAHIVAAGGKRLRPLLTLASARLCGYPGPGRRRAPRRSRRLRRVHPYRDFAARRRRG